LPRVRDAYARKITGRKNVKGKSYTYEYYTMPLNLYLPKSMVERFGTSYEITINEDTGEILIKSKKAKM
jgi:hypothetical protein